MAGHRFGHCAAQKSIEKAKNAKVTCARMFHAGDIRRLGAHAEVAARTGYIGINTLGIGNAASHQRVVPFDGAIGGLSANPIAVGAVMGGDILFVPDFAIGTVAEGKG